MSMIPKKIHWCWLSGDPLPKHLQHCIDSWKRVMPDYEIILWDQFRFDIHSTKFIEDACKARKWAFAADYIRLYALYHEGGIYLDSDVMVFRKFDDFLHYSVFSSVEYIPEMILWRNEKNKHIGYGIQAAIIGAEKGNKYIKDVMDDYDQNITFEMDETGDINIELLPSVLARHACSYGFEYDRPFDAPQYLKENIVIFQPKVLSSLYGQANMRTYALHVGELGWLKARKKESGIREFYKWLCCNYRFFAMLHYRRRHFQKKLAKLFTK